MAMCKVLSKDEVDEATLEEIATACNVSTDRVEDVYGCTPLQLEMMAGTRNEVFHIVLSFGPAGDIERFCEGLRLVVSLNPILRTRFVKCRLGIVQVIVSGEHVTEDRSGDFERYLQHEKGRRLGLGVPVFRSTVVGNMFVATVDHAIMDYWSLTSFLKGDVVGVYMGEPPKKHPDFKEFVAHCMNIDVPTANSFWGSRFKGVPAIFPLVSRGFVPDARQRMVQKMELKKIGNGVSAAHVPMFIEAAWALTAATYSDSENVAFGYVLSGRSSAVNGVLGPMIAEIPIQVNLQRNMTVERLIKDRATSLRQLQTHPALQYGIKRIGAISDAARIASQFQTLLNIRFAMDVPAEKTDSINFDRLVWPQGPFTLDLICSLLDDGILVESRSDPTILPDRQMHRVLNQFEHTLRQLTEAPLQTKLDKLQLLNPHDRAEILQWNKRVPNPVDQCIHDVFSTRAQAQPRVVAVETSDGSITYGQLDEMSSRLAQDLTRKGVSSGTAVALIFDRSLWFLVAMLATLKAGGLCVPIGTSDPDDRKANIIAISSIKAVLTSPKEFAFTVNLNLSTDVNIIVVGAKSFATLPEAVSKTELYNGPNGVPGINRTTATSSPSPDDVAFITFTSGSTGAPKAIMHEHRSLMSPLTSLAQRLGWKKPGCRMLQYANPSSSLSFTEIFGTLLFGGLLCIPTETQTSNLSHFIQSNKVNCAILPPRVIRNMTPDDVPGLQSLISVGEPVDAEAFEIWGDALRFYNGWGVSEASGLSSVAELEPESLYPESIGTPVGCAVWIVNPLHMNELCPIGDVGELLIEGPGVARGYLNADTKMSASFIPPPSWAAACERKSNQAHFYRTGDLGKYNPDGSISFVGRQDNRIKLGGQKVQHEELEGVLAGCSEVREIVTSAKISAGRTQLIAVVCLADPNLPRSVVLKDLSKSCQGLDECLDAVREYASSYLPVDRIPTIWLPVEQLPRTRSEKLDRAAVREWLKSRI